MASATSELTAASWDTKLSDVVAWSDPSLVVQQAGKSFDVLYLGENSSLRLRQFDTGTGWSAEKDFGGVLKGKPAGIAWSSSAVPDSIAIWYGIGDLRVYGRGGDDALYQLTYISRDDFLFDTRWDRVGAPGAMASAPAVASWGRGRTDAFYVGTNGGLEHLYYEGAWSAPDRLGGNVVGDPSAVASPSRRIDVVVRNKAGGIDHISWSPQSPRWTWKTLAGGDVASDPTISSWGEGRLDVMYRGASGTLKHRFTTNYNDWSVEQDLGGALTGAPAAASWGPGHVDVMARDAANHLVRRSWDGLAATSEPTSACAPRTWSSDGTCGGPWRFSRYDAPCTETKTHTDYACTYPTGTDATRDVFVTVTPILKRRSECGGSADERGAPRGCIWVTDKDYATPCDKEAQKTKEALRATDATGFADEVSRPNNCRIALKNIPRSAYGVNNAYCTSLPANQHEVRTRTEIIPKPKEACAVLGPFVSRAGLSVAALGQTEPNLVLAPSAPPVCLTDDATPPSSDPSGKFARLVTGLQTVSSRMAGATSVPTINTSGFYVDNVALESSLVDRLFLLGETYGDRLLPEQRTFLLTLAQSFPEHANTCSASWTPPPREGTCAPVPALDGTLAYCARMLAPTVPGRVADAFLDACLAGAGTLRAAFPSTSTDAACGAPAYGRVERANARALLIKVFTESLPADPAARRSTLVRRLRAMGTWFELHRTAPDAAATAEQLLDAGQVMAAFWKIVHAQAFGSVDAIARDANAPPVAIEGAISALQGKSFEAEREVLLAAYSGTDSAPVLANELLLDVTGDALRPMVEQLRVVTKFHDLSCRLDSCTETGGTTLGDVEGTWAALASLPDGAALAAAVRRLENRAAWAPVFAAVSANHRALERAAVSPSSRPYEARALVDGEPATVDRGGLRGIVRDATARVAVFKQTGLFDATGLGSLRTGLQKEKRDEVVRLIDVRTSAASSALADLQRKRAEAVQTLVGNLQGAQELTALKARAEARSLEFDRLTTNLAALRAGIEGDHRSAADFTASFDAVAKKESATVFAVTRAEHNVEVAASGPGARVRAPNWADISLIAAPWKLSAEPGEIVNFDVKGSWSPVCAFASSVAPDGNPIDATGAFTGSEGFLGRVDNGRYKATQYSSYTGVDHGTKIASTKCEGMSMSGGLSVYGVDLTPRGTVSQQDCEGSEDSTRRGWNDTRSTTNDRRETSSFAVGIRLADTPFPTAPAGALLAVIMPRGVQNRGAQLDVRVVAPTTSIVVAQSSDVYLVVNDAQCPLDNGSLTVRATLLTPKGQLVKALGSAMAATLAELRALEPRFRAAGRMLPEDTAARRQAAVARVDAALPAGTLADFPAFQSLFFSWIDGELAVLRRRVEVDVLEHQRHLLVLELMTLADDVRRADKTSRYLGLSTRWAIENVDGGLLSASASSLGESVSDYLLPLARIRYPAALTKFAATKDVAALARLRNASFATSLAGLVRDEITLVNGLSASVSDAMLEVATTASNVRIVGVSIPNPEYTAPRPASRLRPVDAATAGDVWAQIRGEGRFRFTLSPEMLYDRLGGTGVLACGDAVPVINGMALYVGAAEGGDDPSDPRNTLPTLVPVRYDSQFMFPGSTGNPVYSLTGDAWLSTNVRVLFGQPLYVSNVFGQQFATAQQQAGLSPFARMAVTLERIARDRTVSLVNAPEIDLIYQLDVQAIGSGGLPGVGTCN